ncbi:MaoC/PaaZ C-terminal domain-containing protein [Virgibacillus xinjiangensis]|uniref:MaoC/PaaZ C-terminal domain-containing protein n=1 Tax=Virgibacillus xinjiangensis TaxID=393090 RepID=A0ABV7CZ83_9BACI
MIDKYFDELKMGDDWLSEGRTITETDLVMFSAFSGDWFPIHSNREYAKATPYKERIAHGMLVLSVATGLMRFNSSTVAVFYGMDGLRFVQPTFIGDTIYVKAAVHEKEEHQKKREAGLVTLEVTIQNQRGEGVALGYMKFVVNKKPD